MDATYQSLAAAAELREFTVPMLAARAGVKETTVRTVLNRHRHLFDRSTAESGRRGGQPRVWSVKETARSELDTIIAEIAMRFDDDQGSLVPAADMDIASSSVVGRLRLPGGNPELATAEDLETFAPHLAARELLPHIVQRLLAAAPGVTAVAMRVGDGIGLPGFDGRAEATVASQFVPGGRSVWELGTGSDPWRKAQDDFRRRSDDPGDVDPAVTTFVAVSMRRFRDKEAWVARAKATRVWRDVRACDADDLSAWLEETPPVHIWASEQLGLRPLEVTSLSNWWKSWLAQTEPATPGDLLLAGRRAVARELRQALKPAGQVVGVFASSREEAVAFTAAALQTDDPDDGYFVDVDPLSTAVAVLSNHVWRRLTGPTSRSVLIPLFEGADVASAVGNGHKIVVPMGPHDDRSRARIDVPLIDREEARDVLRASEPSLDLEESDHRAAHARRSLVSFRRRFAVNPAHRSPAWAQKPAADILAPLVLVGSWDADSGADQAVVAALAGRPYSDIERELRRPSDLEDPPFVRAGNRWLLTSPLDAWTLLRSCLGHDYLEHWSSQAARVLTEPDPAAELPPHDRIFAAARGIGREHSSSLRSGLARGTALMASDEGAGRSAPDGRGWPDHAPDLVADILGPSSDPRRWTDLEDVLPALAEAAPDVFLGAVESALSGEHPALKALFTDNQDDIWQARSPHTGLLWALELLCWSPTHAVEACYALARLAQIDPGGRLTNRPMASLRRVLLPWYPQTAAPPSDRIDIVAGILDRWPAVGWTLLLSLLPAHFDSSHPNHRPLFRNWKAQATEVTLSERLDATGQLTGTALGHLRRAPEGWAEFIEVLPNLPREDLVRSLAALADVDIGCVADHVRVSTWRALTKLTESHRRFQTAAWALPSEVLGRFDNVAAAWEPKDSPERHARLFDWHPDLRDTDKSNHAAYEVRLAEVRREVVAQILATSTGDLARLIEEAPVPGSVGATAAEVAGDSVAGSMLASLGKEGPNRLAATGWVIRMGELAGPEWVAAMLRRSYQLPEESRPHLYLALPNEPATWHAVDNDAVAVANQFWQSVRTVTVRPEDALSLVERLLTHRRPWSAVDLLAHHSHWPQSHIPAALIERTLRAAAGPDLDEPHPPGPIDYDLGVLLDRFASSGGSNETLRELEWIFLVPLQHSRRPLALFRALAADPSFFVDLVCSAFRAAGEPAHQGSTPSEQARARQAYMVLREWRRPPGLGDDGSLNGKVLHEWVAIARERLAEADRAAIGDECIGQVLSGAPPGADGVWPPEPIRQLLEELDSEPFSRGLAIGKFNARGLTSRRIFDGGRQEDALADQYEKWSKQVMARWPETGRMLRELARSYRTWARREDAASEQWANAE